jgi:CubicO group peptidase (beta-lactamase class C family)
VAGTVHAAEPPPGEQNAGTAARQRRLPIVSPAEAGFDAESLAAMEPLIEAAIAERKLPGAVVCLGRRGRIGWLKAYGDKQLTPERQPMAVDTVFDLASLTKPIATATAIMKLVDIGRVRIDDPVVKHLPEFAPQGKDVLTLEDLLVHHSGLIADNPLSDYGDGRERAWQRICELKLLSPPRTKFIYSDVNFIVLGELASRVSGEPLERFVRERLFEPLGMRETGYVPGPELRARAAPTQQREGRWMLGEVHDPRAWKLGGVAGHAGVFSTATDLALYAQAMLNRGQLGETRVLAAETVERMTRGYTVSSGLRGLGWDKRTGFSINRGERLSDAAFGHGGFTGTVIWIDPQLDLFFIFLSNRVHPDGKGVVNPLAGKLATIAAAAIR